MAILNDINKRAKKPPVSVCIPAYNAAGYIGDAIESVLGQAFKDFELIVVDNNSSDGTASIVSRYNDPRLFYVKNPGTVPMAENWNKCISLASGKYIVLLHADDAILPGSLGSHLKAMEGDAQVGYAYSASRIIDEESNIISDSIPFTKSHVKEGSDQFLKHIIGNYIYCPSIMVRRECYERVGSFNKELKYFVDWDMWLRIELGRYKVAYIPEVLASYRVHKGSITSSGFTQTPEAIKEYYKVIHDNLTSKSFDGLFSGHEAKAIKDEALLKFLAQYFVVIFRAYLMKGEYASFNDSFIFLLSTMFKDGRFRLSLSSIAVFIKLSAGKIRKVFNKEHEKI